MHDDMDTILTNIREKLIAGVEKRLDADAPVGFLLSGGLDSSLVCSIAAKKLGKPIRTFAIGMDTDAIDLKYARQTAEYLGSEHHEIIINRDIVIQNLEEVIRLLGTWDITTIRASMGMYLLCKAIHEQTDVRVLLTGEISDELFGYKYTDYAPTADAFQQESQKRIRELYMYDVLRADRCISANSIEARVPFGDLDFVRYVMAIDPEKKLNSYGKGKYLTSLFAKVVSIPQQILTPIIVIFCFAGAYSVNSSYFDLSVALVFGVMAWFMRKLELPAVPVLLGMVLGNMTETNFRRALLISDGSPSIFFGSVYCWIFIALIVVVILGILRGKMKEAKVKQ